MAKGQIAGQIVVFILAIVIFSLIIVYGYNAIKGFSEKADTVSVIKFRTDFTTSVNEISTDYDSIKKEIFTLPDKYKEVCFADRNGGNGGITNPIILDAIADTSDNVFLVKDSGMEPFSVGPLSIPAGENCITMVGNKIKIQFKGLGDAAEITSW